MTIFKEELKSLPGEIEIKVESVFLENAPQPSSAYAEDIPRGILRLTSRRLFFFCTGKGKDNGFSDKYGSLLTLTGLVSVFVPQGDKIMEFIGGSSRLGFQFWKSKKLKHSDMYPFLDSEYSFVLPIDRIVNCEIYFGKTDESKLRRVVSALYLDENKFFKHRYVRLDIENDGKTITNYCIYCNRPLDPKEYRNIIRYDKWYKEITKLRSNNFLFSTR